MSNPIAIASLAVILGALSVSLAAAAPASPSRPIPPAIGPYIGNLKAADFAGARNFAATDKLVATYYFYWYDIYTKTHVLDHDGSDALTDHPPTLEDFSYKSVAWHKKELADMIDAGIDVAMPVFWGAPSEHQPGAMLHWSYAGLPPMIEAREALLKAGKKPPYFALFYDTSTLQYNQWGARIDLTTDFGRQWFYATIRDFFSMIPPKHWALHEGKPIVLLYSASFALAHDQSCIDHVKAEFPKEFAGRIPYLVRQNSWKVTTDNTCAWGGALGLVNPGVASLGPGYDHSAVPGRTPLIVKREGGKFYEDNWLKFLRRPSNMVTIETWNEFHEGTTICDSKEYGRQYIELTRKYVDLFKKGWVPPWPKGAFDQAKSVSVALGEKNDEKGLKQVENDDGATAPAKIDGRMARASVPYPQGGTYLYLVVDDSFKTAGVRDFELVVDYYDAAPGSLGVEYDGTDETAAFNGAYTHAPSTIKLEGSKTWKTARFRLPAARFVNSQNRGADLRLVIQSPQFAAGKITLLK